MYIESVPNRQSPPAVLLRESYRLDDKIKKRTLANLTDWPDDVVAGVRTLLKGGVAVDRAERRSLGDLGTLCLNTVSLPSNPAGRSPHVGARPATT